MALNAITIFAPAKLNLLLAITGRRTDGFHDLVSVVAPLDFGDTLRAEPNNSGIFALTSDSAEIPLDESNLVIKAAKVFAAATGWRGGANFHLEKKIPTGAGLGGGSSDGVAALKALNALAGEPLGAARISDLAAQLGSDCPLFLAGGPVVMRGRGERVEVLPPGAAAWLTGLRVLVFKPGFEVSTAWAYREMAARQNLYEPAAAAEARVAAWVENPAAPTDALLFNNMERVAFAKYVALPAMLERLRAEFGLTPRMSGSGSACFAVLPDGAPVERIIARIHDGWGDSAFVIQAKLASTDAAVRVTS
jgi:4-diphosphocytidyl-2-C-methyl-D-erythritol kinase